MTVVGSWARCRANVQTVHTANALFEVRTGNVAPDIEALVNGGYLRSAADVTMTQGQTIPASPAQCDAPAELVSHVDDAP